MGENLKKYGLYVLAVIAIVVILYFIFRKPKNKSTDTKALPTPSIAEAKKDLETKLFSNDFVNGIGTRNVDSKSFIQVSVKSEDHVKDIKAFLTDGTSWEGFPVDIIVEPTPSAQANTQKKEAPVKTPKTKWYFKTIIPSISANQKRLAVNIQAGDKLIPEQFKVGEIIKLNIHQTHDYTYTVSANIVSIDSNRDSMLVNFKGIVTEKAFGEAVI